MCLKEGQLLSGRRSSGSFLSVAFLCFHALSGLAVKQTFGNRVSDRSAGCGV